MISGFLLPAKPASSKVLVFLLVRTSLSGWSNRLLRAPVERVVVWRQLGTLLGLVSSGFTVASGSASSRPPPASQGLVGQSGPHNTPAAVLWKLGGQSALRLPSFGPWFVTESLSPAQASVSSPGWPPVFRQRRWEPGGLRASLRVLSGHLRPRCQPASPGVPLERAGAGHSLRDMPPAQPSGATPHREPSRSVLPVVQAWHTRAAGCMPHSTCLLECVWARRAPVLGPGPGVLPVSSQGPPPGLVALRS